MSLNVVVCPARNPRAANVVAGILELERDLVVSTCAACIGEPATDTRPADVVILTAGLPDMRDLAQIEMALWRHNRVPVIVLSVYDEPQVTSHLLAQGASGFLALDQVIGKLARMIRRVSRTTPAGRLPGGLAAGLAP